MTGENAAADAAGDGGMLSVEAATDLLLGGPPREEEAPAAAAGDDAGASAEIEIPADQAAEEAETAQPDEAADEAGEEGETREPASPAIKPPTSWDAEAQAAFAQLPPELQTKVAEIQAQRDRQTNEAQQRAAETARRAEAEIQGSAQLRAQLSQILPRAQQVFQDRWANIDWAAWAAQDPAAAYQGELQMRSDRAELVQLQQAQQAAQAQERQRFYQTEGPRLAQLAPDLVDTAKGAERRQELQKFLNTNGIPDGVISQADASMLSLAYDAMRFRGLQAQAQQQLARKPATPPAKQGLRPGAQRPGNSQSRQAASASQRLSQTGKVDDAVALLLARGG
jgi:hypothetical protein